MKLPDPADGGLIIWQKPVAIGRNATLVHGQSFVLISLSIAAGLSPFEQLDVCKPWA